MGALLIVTIFAILTSAFFAHGESGRLREALALEQARVDHLMQDAQADQLIRAAKLNALAAAANSPNRPQLVRTVVGGRNLAPQYYGRGCSSSEFLQAISNITVNPEGNTRNPPDNPTYDLEDFTFSFTMPEGCAPPHVYTSAEACDLVDAFGGIFLRGDSLMRHVTNALFMILRNSREGAVLQDQDVCFGDRMFDDQKDCRKVGLFDSQEKDLIESPTAQPVCSGKTWLYFEQLPCPVEPSRYVPAYLDWRSRLGTNASSLSTVMIQSYGLHCHFKPWIPLFGVFKPLLTHAASAFPRPLLLWLGVSAPGSNKPIEYLQTQGADQVKTYNEAIASVLPTLQDSTESLAEGRMGVMETYGMTNGAKSFDGTHYMYHVNVSGVTFTACRFSPCRPS